jgi:hypothetical protein
MLPPLNRPVPDVGLGDFSADDATGLEGRPTAVDVLLRRRQGPGMTRRRLRTKRETRYRGPCGWAPPNLISNAQRVVSIGQINRSPATAGAAEPPSPQCAPHSIVQGQTRPPFIHKSAHATITSIRAPRSSGWPTGEADPCSGTGAAIIGAERHRPGRRATLHVADSMISQLSASGGAHAEPVPGRSPPAPSSLTHPARFTARDRRCVDRASRR